MGLESQKFKKGHAAVLPSVQSDSQLPGSNMFFYLHACEFRNRSKPLNQGKNIEYFFVFKSREISVLTQLSFFMERDTQE